MQRIPHTIASHIAPCRSPIDSEITEEKLSSLYKILKERTSSSPSGRHLGHYKVAAEHTDIMEVYTEMMQIPHLAGISPNCWNNVIDVMLEKNPGHWRIHWLQIVALQESDFNQCNRLAIGRPLLWHLEDTGLIPEMQYGSRPKKICLSAVLNKVLTFEVLRYAKDTMAFIENDAVSCYDRITNSLILLFLSKLGIPKNALRSLRSTWKNAVHRMKTQYGISDEYYANSFVELLFGPGQGSTIAPILWLLCFILIHVSLRQTAPTLQLKLVRRDCALNSRGEAFVDGTSLGCNAQAAEEEPQPNHKDCRQLVVDNLTTLAQ